MKIWFQTYSPSAHIDPRWRPYEEACRRYLPKVVRPGTEVHFAATDTRAPKMILSSYIQYLHLGQVIENAIRAEREGYDAFVVGGMRDLGYAELREAVDIPVLFISEVSYHLASMLAPTFALVHSDEHPLQVATGIIRKYGLEARTVPGVHLGYSQTDLLHAFETRPQEMIEEIKAAARKPIKEGAALLVTGFAAISVFLGENGVRDVDGVPILDGQAAALKMAELQVDLRKLGMPKPRKGPGFDVSKADIAAARKIYGLS